MKVAWVFVLIAVLVGGALLGWRYLDERQERQKQEELRENAVAVQRSLDRSRTERDFFKESPVEITAAELIKVYRTNELDARQRFLEKHLHIDGHVERLTVERWTNAEYPVLYFAEGGACIFNRKDGVQSAELAKLKRGQQVIVSGQGRGPQPPLPHLTTHCMLDSTYE